MSSDFLQGVPMRPYVQSTPRQTKTQQKTANQAFAGTLEKALQESTDVKFSAHALTRLQQRGIKLSPNDLKNMAEGMRMLQEKGTKDGYLLYGNQGFVVNVPSHTVVTTMQHDKATVITNIDSVAIIPQLDR